MSLANKIAIVTGGSRGIGREIAVRFARDGAKLTIVGRDKARCDEVVARIVKDGGEAMSVQADITVESDVAGIVERTIEKYQRIDILVCSAGTNLPYRTVADLSLKDWKWVIETNLTGTFLCCRAVLPQMMAQKGGRIINISSLGGRRGAPGRAAYRASKAGIINFSECLAAEVKDFDINVNAICPGVVNTEMVREITGGQMPAYSIPAEDIAAVVAFLASDESRAVTGTAIDILGQRSPFFGVSPSFADRKK